MTLLDEINGIATWVVPTAMASASYWHARKAHRQVQSPNGVTTGKAVAELKKQAEKDRKYTNERFRIVNRNIREILGILAKDKQ